MDGKKSQGAEIKPSSDETTPQTTSSWSRYTSRGFTIMPAFWELKDEIKKLEAKPGDVWVAPFPKSGTTWLQEMTWLLSHNLDYEGAKALLKNRSPSLESTLQAHRFFNTERITLKKFEEIAASSGGRRVLKTHLRWEYLPEQATDPNGPAKIIYAVRNPKDVCVSYYYYMFLNTDSLTREELTLEKFSRMFMSENVMYGPYWEHVAGFWLHRHQPNVLFVRYEDMKKDLRSNVEKVATFLDVPVPTGEQMEKFLNHLSFDSMKDNSSVNGLDSPAKAPASSDNPEVGKFIRKGVVGDYKQKFSPETIKKFDEWIRVHATEIGIPFEDWLG